MGLGAAEITTVGIEGANEGDDAPGLEIELVWPFVCVREGRVGLLPLEGA